MICKGQRGDDYTREFIQLERCIIKNCKQIELKGKWMMLIHKLNKMHLIGPDPFHADSLWCC